MITRRRILLDNGGGYENKYFTFTALDNGTFTLTIPSTVTTTYLTSVSYSIDNGEWVTTNNSNSDVVITTPTVTAGKKVRWKGLGSQYAVSSATTDASIFSSTADFDVEGNIMSLLYADNFSGQTSLSGKDYAFCRLFSGCAKLTKADNMVLPATTLAESCYRNMFQNCTNLTTVPSDLLPATTLASDCYRNMFQNCTNLTTVPELPATTLADSCYNSMFNNCTNLTTVPELPATTLASDCYRYMFASCPSLTTVPSDLLPATTLAENCYRLMFQNCTSLTTAPELPATTLASNCYYLMFNNCSLTTAPELPATTLAVGCYQHMFQGCTSLTTAPELPATTLAVGCYQEMFNRCTSLTTAPELLATTLAENCYYQMFLNCTSLTTAPELLATTLAENCYYQMFLNCTSLSSIKCLATDISASDCTTNWVNNVAASGTFTKAASMTGWTTGVNGIPSGWTVANGYEYVDLGLPSGTKWATMNVGATSETDYGNYYQYGKGAAQYAATSGDSNYSGTEDPLATSADTAAQVWGGSWHMPTRAQMEELTANTTYQWVTDYKGSGINGGTFTATNGAVLFLPAAGLWSDGSQNLVGNYGDYWGSSPGGSSSAYSLYFSNGRKDVSNGNRKYGFSVRPVVG